MTSYGMNRTSVSTGNPLCDRLKRQFANRCSTAVARYKAPATSEMIRRVQRGLDPYENAPNPLAETTRRVAVAPATAVRKPQPQSAPQKKAQNPAVRPACAKTAETKRETAVSPVSAEMKRVRSAAAAARTAKAKAGVEEVRIARAPFPFAALITVTIFTVILLSVLYTFAQNYELSGEISALEAQRDAILAEEEALVLQLEERDDIRVIEDIAVNQIGMVKNDLVENRFVSVSGGNRVELAQPETDEEEKNENIFSGMLSAIGENFEKIKEYID